VEETKGTRVKKEQGGTRGRGEGIRFPKSKEGVEVCGGVWILQSLSGVGGNSSFELGVDRIMERLSRSEREGKEMGESNLGGKVYRKVK